MENAIEKALRRHWIDCFGTISLSDCTLRKPYLLEREHIRDGSAVMFAIPYYTKGDGPRNLSRYAVPRDYHFYIDTLKKTLLQELQSLFPGESFVLFADHSPIDEREAAAKAGLGILGDNGLLITEKYSSFVFIAEIITSLSLPTRVHPIRHCEGCGACRTACPWARGEVKECLSAVTQKKGSLSIEEIKAMKTYKTVWGCDICSEVCPHTLSAYAAGTLASPIPFFNQNRIFCLTPQVLDAMSDQEFQERAYSWRGRDTIQRNLYLEQSNERKD